MIDLVFAEIQSLGWFETDERELDMSAAG